LESNHLTVTQFPDHVGEAPALTTILMHNSGEWISGTYPLMVTDKESTPQGYGSALTYARRYGLSAVLGVIADEDDDGNAASKREKPAAPKPVSQPDPEVSKPTAQWKIEGLAEAEKGSDQLYLWWRALPKPVQLLLTKYKDETLKPAAERADKVMA
jgi:hypothetical protein